MSDSDIQRSSSSGDHSGGGGDDDEDGENVCRGDCKVNRKKRGFSYKKGFRSVKQILKAPFRKGNRQSIHTPNRKIEPSRSGFGSGSGSAAIATMSLRGRRMIGCCLCMKQPLTLESSSTVDCHTPDPNNPDVFTYEHLKSLIEKNDFYSKECNPHIDIRID